MEAQSPLVFTRGLSNDPFRQQEKFSVPVTISHSRYDLILSVHLLSHLFLSVLLTTIFMHVFVSFLHATKLCYT